MLTKDIVSFEQLGPDISIKHFHLVTKTSIVSYNMPVQLTVRKEELLGQPENVSLYPVYRNCLGSQIIFLQNDHDEDTA